MQKDLHSCPNCKTRLRFVDGRLKHEGTTSNEPTTTKTIDEITDVINSLTRDLEIKKEIVEITGSYEEQLPDINDVKQDLKYLREYFYEQTENEKTKISIEYEISNNIFSKTCSSFRDKVVKYKEKLESLENIEVEIPEGMTEDSLREMVDDYKEKYMKESYRIENLNELTIRRKRYQAKNEKLMDEYKDDDIKIKIKTVKDQILENEDMLVKLKNKHDKHNSNNIQIEKWKRMMEDLKRYNAWEEKVLTLQNVETQTQKEYSAAMTLKDKILEAESIAMINLVESINTHARVYLDDFFEDDPIVVSLQAFKQTKKVTKAQINMDIEYKGMECDLQMLSGGEMSRIVLAYTLALAEMFNSPLLLLDECTSSLDQETTNHVFDAIKEHFNGKLTIIVAHQVVTGIFDRTINL